MKKVVLMLAVLLFGISASAQKPAVVASDKTGWHKIGETTVDFGKDVDEVAVLVADRFASLKFKVDEAPIELLDIDVYFEEGDMQNIRIGYAIKNAGAESREIDLKGGSERNLKKIVFRYKTVENRADKKAHLEIWGRKSNAVKGKGASNADRETREMKKDAKEAGHDAKKEAKKDAREVKKEAKEAKKDAEKEMNK
jgi:hypothetical protein